MPTSNRVTRTRLTIAALVAAGAAIGGGYEIGRSSTAPSAAPSGAPSPIPTPSPSPTSTSETPNGNGNGNGSGNGAGASRQPGDTLAATTRRLAALGKPSTRQFDLLSEVIEPGAAMTTSANLSWADPHDCTWIVAPEILSYFPAAQLTAGKVTTASGKNTGPAHARFAAVVTCETAEATPQKPRDFRAGWPALVGPALEADLAKPPHEMTAEERAILGAAETSPKTQTMPATPPAKRKSTKP